MAFPAGWPPRRSPTVRPVRFFKTATSTANFSDRAWLFGSDAAGQPVESANVDPLPYVTGSSPGGAVPQVPWGGGRAPEDNTEVPLRFSGSLRICNDSANATDAIEFSFDGTNVHGEVHGGEQFVYRSRQEAGIAIRTKAASNNCVFRIEAW